MARINIDSSFFGDKRIDRLAKLSGEDPIMTRGRMLHLWHHCYLQRSAVLTEQEIDLHTEWLGDKPFAELLVISHLASPEGSEKVDRTYRISGVEDRIDYLVQRSEGGKRSAEVRRKKYGTSKPGIKNAEHPQKTHRTSPEDHLKITEPPTLSPSPPPDLALAPSLSSGGALIAPPEERVKKINTIAIERALEKRSIAIADKLMGVFREVGGDEFAAQASLPTWVWDAVVNRWRKWDAFCIEATNAFQSGKATFFQHQLRQSITAALLLANDQRGA